MSKYFSWGDLLKTTIINGRRFELRLYGVVLSHNVLLGIIRSREVRRG